MKEEIGIKTVAVITIVTLLIVVGIMVFGEYEKNRGKEVTLGYKESV